jgi:mRNA-degrading endonuclease RelE of RelBE toxin-antitoxin system
MRVQLHPDAEADLDLLWMHDQEAAADIEVILEEADLDPRVLDKLTQHGNNELPSGKELNVKRWEKASRVLKRDVWRLRVLNSPATSYRIVYGYHIQHRQIYVLGIIHKGSFNYDDLTDNFCSRCLAAWVDI